MSPSAHWWELSLDPAPAEALQAGRTHSTVALQSLSDPSNTSEGKGALSSGERGVISGKPACLKSRARGKQSP